ncbi:hypothetical protein SAY87_024630 [Trapa incisa]|uniref:Carboxymethylenebutenolidase homolog n=1 Tax=Trapa incisa TaxID=236973 RepID=A0AAN7GQR8_9MYRT|nr:hypothetical protein SAY87_024630 [Trapa incisa]
MASTMVSLFTASVSSSCSRSSPVPDGSILRSSFLPIRASPRLHSPANCKSIIWRSHGRHAAKKTRCSMPKLENENDEVCELVSGTEISLGEGSDSIHAYLFNAVKNNNGTGILLLSDVFGFEDSFTRDFAYRVACSGYNVLVPDLFRGDPWREDRPNSDFNRWISSHYPERMQNDITTSRDWMVDELSSAGISKKLGIIGFCLGGGRVVEALAQDQGAHFGVGVSFYGTKIDPSLGPSINVPLLSISGDEDPLCQVSHLEDLHKGMKDSEMVIFEGRGHGFAHRPQSPEEDRDAEQAFLFMRNWLHDRLLVDT